MKGTLLLMLQLIPACIGMNPCIDYVSIHMAGGQRSSNFDSTNSEISLCDAYLNPATWYRFEHDAGNRLIEGPVDPWYCGTQAPLWLNGIHPTVLDRSEVTVGVCATYSSANKCGWSGTVRIRLCNESGSEYFVYLLAVPPGCALAYCVDAASRKQCIPPEVWLEDEFRCGGALSSTVPLTTSAIASQSLASTLIPSTEPASFGWSKWGPWSVCSKQCDYGHQSRRRTCGHLPCESQSYDDQVCNEYSCQKLPEEKTRGISLILQCSDSNEDTMLTVVMNQPEIHSILRKNINDLCSKNVSMCCGWQYNGISQLHQDFVLSEDIYPAQGSLQPRTDNTVYYQVIAVVNEDVHRSTCKGNSRRIFSRQVESSPNFLSVDVMMMASVKSADKISQVTGLIVTDHIDPATVMEDDYEEDEGSCPSLTCVLPIVLCIAVLVPALAIGGFCFAKSKLKPKTEPESQSAEPPHYEEVLATDLRMNINGLAYIITPLPLNVSHNVYDTLADEESMDFQKRDLDVQSKNC